MPAPEYLDWPWPNPMTAEDGVCWVHVILQWRWLTKSFQGQSPLAISVLQDRRDAAFMYALTLRRSDPIAFVTHLAVGGFAT